MRRTRSPSTVGDACGRPPRRSPAGRCPPGARRPARSPPSGCRRLSRGARTLSPRNGPCRVAARRAIFVAPFGELVRAARLARLAAEAEAAGWDGFFVWDHLVYTAVTRDLADPWVAMAAIACATERVRIGALVTPTPRRRIQKLARETVTLDRLSGGRLVLGVGIGGDRHGEFEPFGDEADARERARRLDADLDAAGRAVGRRVPAPARAAAADPGLGRRRAGRTGGRSRAPRAGTGSSRSSCPGRRRWPSWSPRCVRCERTTARSTSWSTNPAGHRLPGRGRRRARRGA